MSDIIRNGKTIAGIVCGTDAAGSTEINVVGFSSMNVNIPSGATLTTLALYHAPTSGGTYLPVYRLGADQAAEAVSFTSVDQSMALSIPEEMMAGCQFVKLIASAETTVSVSLKS